MKLSKTIKTLAAVAAFLLPIMPASAAADERVPENRVIYEVFVRNFSPEGNFAGVEKQVPRLRELGVDVIWLMPIYKLGDIGKWGTYSSPYAIKDYKAIDPDNGTAAQLHSLIDAIHANGMEVWFDWVGNHTSKDNVWVSSHPEYYGYNFYSPNGWNDVYQLDINNEAMHEAMIDAMQYWVTEFGVDGYRCDYAGGPSEEFWRKATSRVLKNGKRIAWLAEDDSKPQLVSKGYFDYNYVWEFCRTLHQFKNNGKSLNDIRNHCMNLHNDSQFNGRSRMVYLSNHDQVQDEGGSAVRRFGNYVKPFTVLEFTVYGMPLLYNGQEIGCDYGQVMLSEKTPLDWSNPDDSMTDLIRKLIDLKHAQPALRTGAQKGTLTNLSTSNSNNIYAFRRSYNGCDVVVMLNFSGSQQSFTINGGLPSGQFTDAFSGNTADFATQKNFTLPAYGYAVYTSDSQGVVTPPEPSTPHYLYVENKTGWNPVYVYAYNDSETDADGNAPFGSWPGTAADGSYSVNGRTYARVQIPEQMQGKSYSFIFNNGSGQQCADLPGEVNGDIYFNDVTFGTPVETEYYLYVENRTGWGQTYVYAYNDNETSPLGSWPGKAMSTSSQSIDGHDYIRVEIPENMQSKSYNFIVNNGGGSQCADIPASVDGNVYLNDVTQSGGYQTFHIYMEDNTAWNNLYIYAWGDAEAFGTWPGIPSTGSHYYSGHIFSRVEIPRAHSGKNVNLIVNNNTGTQYDLASVRLDRNHYFSLNSGNGKALEFNLATGIDEPESCVTDTCGMEPVYFTLTGVRVDNPSHGIFIEVRGERSRKVRL